MNIELQFQKKVSNEYMNKITSAKKKVMQTQLKMTKQ